MKAKIKEQHRSCNHYMNMLKLSGRFSQLDNVFNVGIFQRFGGHIELKTLFV